MENYNTQIKKKKASSAKQRQRQAFHRIQGIPHTILSIVALVLELVSYILYLRALSKGKKMLAK